MLLNLLGFSLLSAFGKTGTDAQEAVSKAVGQSLIVLLGVGIIIIGIVFIVGGSKTVATVSKVAALV